MTATPTEHRAKIAEARNVLGEVISRARFGNEPTILINRGKEAAVIVSHPFYEQAKRDRALIELLKRRAEEGQAGATADARLKGEAPHVALAAPERDLDDRRLPSSPSGPATPRPFAGPPVRRARDAGG